MHFPGILKCLDVPLFCSMKLCVLSDKYICLLLFMAGKVIVASLLPLLIRIETNLNSPECMKASDTTLESSETDETLTAPGRIK
jgi:hypothetical protein